MAAARKAQIRRRLEDVRTRTLWLLERVPDEFLRVRVHDFYSPIGWHFGHVGRTEEFWTVGEAMGMPLLDDALTFILADTPDNPKDNRVNIPDRAGLVDYLQRTRASVLNALDEADLDSPDPILAEGYAWEFAVQHECQHQETIAEMLCLIQRRRPQFPATGEQRTAPTSTEFVRLPGGEFEMGSDDPFGYDNEKRAHRVSVAPFRLARRPVTVSQWIEFIEDGGYDRTFFSEAGERWLEATFGPQGKRLPEHWVVQEWPHDTWATHGPWGLRLLHPDEPVCGVSAYEADAFARWAGKRLPTEEEWEYAASLSGGRYPWGDDEPTDADANFGLKRWGPTPVGRHREANGFFDLAGNVWEWTASAFLPYPGFAAYPYDGYSKDHMAGDHRVCRGGSWATSPSILRRSFRNWYVPGYRQGFLGLRLADDA